MINNKTRSQKCYLVRKSPKSLNLMVSRYNASMSTFFHHTARDKKGSYNGKSWFIDPQNCHSKKCHKKDIFTYLVYVSV